MQWAHCVKQRFIYDEDRKAFLESTPESNEKVRDLQEKTFKKEVFYITGFNVMPGFINHVDFTKKGDMSLQFVSAAYNKKAGWGEFYMEFDHQVWENDLVEIFETNGVTQVCSKGYLLNDDTEWPSIHLSWVWGSAQYHGYSEQLGVCSEKNLVKALAIIKGHV